MPITTGGVANYNQKFVDLMEHFDTFLMERYRKHPMIWTDRVPMGTLTPFEGLTRKSHIFHGGLGAQAGLSDWDSIQISRAAAGDDPGHDACAYDPTTFSYAYETIQYSGKRCSWQSEPICVNDIRFTAEAKQQCQMIVSMLSYITQSVWENWNRENYVKMAVDAGNAFVLTEGGLDYADSPSVRFTYDPYTPDSDGNTYIQFLKTFKISTLNWSFFDWWQDFLGDQCPEAAVANSDGLPIFAMLMHKRDFNKMVMEDDALREDYRYANSRVLIDDYRTFKEFKGWALVHDPRQMRFSIKAEDSGGTKFKAVRVKPMKEGRAVTIGNLPTADADYTKAELAIGVIFMNQVIQNLIPTPISNMGGGMVFGAQPGYNGKFMWINEYDKDLNPLKEVGYFFARFEAFPKPLIYSGEAIVFLYMREPHVVRTKAAISTDSTAAATQLVATAAAAADVVAATKLVKLTLAGYLTGNVGSQVTITDDDAAAYTAYIASASDAPTYTFLCDSTVPTYTDLTTTASVTVV